MYELEYFRSTYRLPGHDEPTTMIGRIAYECFDLHVWVFSGLDQSGRSTINAAEEIIGLICSEQNIDPRQQTFYDLQTACSYDNPPGHFEYERLELEFDRGRFHVTTWHREDCPQAVLSAFEMQIGPSPYQQQHGGDYRPGALEDWHRQQSQSRLPKPEVRKLFPWVTMSYHEAYTRFEEELTAPYVQMGIPSPKFRAILSTLETSFCNGLGRSNFAKVDHQLIQYLACWIGWAIREGGQGVDDHSYKHVLEGFIRTLVRAIRMNEIHLRGDHAFYRGYQLPDWFVGWAFTWNYTPGEEGDA